MAISLPGPDAVKALLPADLDVSSRYVRMEKRAHECTIAFGTTFRSMSSLRSRNLDLEQVCKTDVCIKQYTYYERRSSFYELISQKQV
jgi:hypothetical protein